MRNLILFLFHLLWASFVFSQQSTICGVVSIQNSRTETGTRHFVSNAQVFDEEGKATPQLTNDKGEFKLILVGVPENSTIKLNIKAKGLKVVNIDALSVVVNQTDTVKIAMSVPEKLADFRNKLYNVGRTSAQKNLEKKLQKTLNSLAILNKERSLNLGKIKSLENAAQQITENLQRVDSIAKELSDKYATINLDDVSPTFKAAFDLFRKGMLDSSLIVLQKADLSKKARKLIAEKKKIEQLKEETLSREVKVKQEEKSLSGLLLLQARLYKSNFNIDSSLNSYHLLYEIDTTNFNNLYEYANTCLGLGLNLRAINLFLKSITLVPTLYQKAVVFNLLGIAYSNIDSSKNSDFYYLQGLDIIHNSNDNSNFKVLEIITKSNLAKNKSSSLRLDTAEILLSQVLASAKQFESNDDIITLIARSLEMLAVAKSIQRDFTNADSLYNLSIKVLKSLKNRDEQSTFYYLTFVSDFSMSLIDQYRFKEAEDLLRKIYDTVMLAYKNSPYLESTNLVKHFLLKGLLYFRSSRYDQSLINYQRVLSELKQVKLVGASYNNILSKTYIDISLLYTHLGWQDSAEYYLKKCIYIRQQFVGDSTEPHLWEYGNALRMIGRVYFQMKQLQESELYYLKAKEVFLCMLSRFKNLHYEIPMDEIENMLLNIKDFKNK